MFSLRRDPTCRNLPQSIIRLYFAGIWGTMAVPISNTGATYPAQAIGVGAVAAFVIVSSLVMWLLLSVTLGLRPKPEDEMVGLDKAEIGLEAYPEFGAGSQRM